MKLEAAFRLKHRDGFSKKAVLTVIASLYGFDLLRNSIPGNTVLKRTIKSQLP